MPEGTVTIYSKDMLKKLPKELNPKNDTDGMTDYYEADRARVRPGDRFFDDINKIIDLK